MANKMCPVCGISLSELGPTERPTGTYPFKATALVNDYPGAPAYEVHLGCVGKDIRRQMAGKPRSGTGGAAG